MRIGYIMSINEYGTIIWCCLVVIKMALLLLLYLVEGDCLFDNHTYVFIIVRLLWREGVTSDLVVAC